MEPRTESRTASTGNMCMAICVAVTIPTATFAQGTFQFLSAQDHPVASGWQYYRTLTGKLNNDDYDDLIWNETIATGNRTYVGLSNGDGTFQFLPAQDHPVASGWQYYKSLTGKVNRDPHDDLIWNETKATGNRIYVALANGNGTFTFRSPQNHPVASGWQYYKTLLADVNGDLRDDLIWNETKETGNRTYVGLANPNGTFRFLPAQDHPVASGWQHYKTLTAKVNDDDYHDLIWNATGTGNRTYVGLANGDGTFQFLPAQDHPVASGWQYYRTLTGKVNDDEYDDLIWNAAGTSRTGSGNRTYVALANGNGTFQFLPAQDHPGASGWYVRGTLTADVNGDGSDDLVWSETLVPNNRTWVGLGLGDGTFHFLPVQVHPVVGNWYPFWTLAADVNDDGHDDLVWNATGTGNRVYVGLGN